MDKLILMCCSFFSCIIIVSIMFQFWNERYIKTFDNKYLYLFLQIVNVFSVMLANMLMNTAVNLAINILWVGAVSIFFYRENDTKHFMRIVEAEALLAANGVAEALGVYFIDVLMQVLKITPESAEILQSVETAFSKIMLLFLYYVVFSRIWKRNMLRTATQYILYLVMFIYGIVNILITAAISSKEHPLVLLLIIGFDIFANMYLLYFMKCLDERNYFKLQVEMMKQQEKMQFENYEIQKEKYEEAMSILHDVKKHIAVIEEMYRENMNQEAISYTRQINEMLRPLVPLQYVNNPTFNCLLSEKIRTGERLGINFRIEISTADVEFMEPLDITTLFGNLLDNAIAACKKCSAEKYVGLYMQAYHEMLSIRVENSISESVEIQNGKIISGRRGIGLLNIQRCIDKYDGSIVYKSSEKLLICDILLNGTYH